MQGLFQSCHILLAFAAHLTAVAPLANTGISLWGHPVGALALSLSAVCRHFLS